MAQLNLLIATIVIFCGHHAAAQGIIKCKIGNSTCEMSSYLSVALNVIANGSPALGIPSMRPLYVKDVPVSFLNGLIQATLDDGACYDLGTCQLLYARTDVKTFRKQAEILCERIVINGTYTIKTNPFFAKISNVSGSGKVEIVAEDWYFVFDYPFKFVKREDGEIYIEPDYDAGKYTSEVLKKFTVAFENITVNGFDVTEKIVNLINTFWKIFLETIGKPFHTVSVDYYYSMYKIFYNGVPATNMFIDDLTQYL